MMKRITTIFLLFLVPFALKAQFFGLAGQYADGSDGQFVASFSVPTWHNKNPLNSYISSGLEYSTSGGAKMSGLNIKPIQFSTFISEDLYNNNPFTILLGVDAGYLFDFRKNRQNAIVLTPNFHFDYKVVYLKTGYDFDVSHGRSQFFIRVGACLSLGSFKVVENTKIW